MNVQDARLEIVTYVEAKFGFKMRDSKSSDTGSRGHSDPMDVDAFNSLASGEGKGSLSPRDGCSKVRWCTFSTRLQCTQSKQSSGKGKQGKSLSKSDGKGKSKESTGTYSEISKGSNGAKRFVQGLQNLEN